MMRLPGLHSIHWKVFLLQLAVLILPMTYVAFKVRDSINTSYLHSTEEGMIDTAGVVAELYARLYNEYGTDPEKLGAEFTKIYSNLNESFQIKARLFGSTKSEVDTRLMVFDKSGHVIFDTAGSATGQDYSKWRDVHHALEGQYGSRWELDRKRQRVNIYSTLPVLIHGRIIGAVSVSQPTNRIRNFITHSFKELALPAAIGLLLATGAAYAFSAYMTRILWDLAWRAERIAGGERNIRLETWSRSELGTLARAVDHMRARLEGKAYVEEMASNLSHELKTPLAAIRGSAEVLEDGAMNDLAARAKFLANIKAEVERLDRIVNELLKLSRIETHATDRAAEPIDPAAVAWEVVAIYQERMKDGGVHFMAELDSDLPRVALPELELKQLLTNLLDNAFQFTPAGHTVRLSMRRLEEELEICVADEGQGIERELLPKVFDRFFTTENPRTGNRGTGLGLAIVKSIAVINGGDVFVRSNSGQGSRFTVRLPNATGAAMRV